MAREEKSLRRMRRNPRDWRIEDLEAVADRFGIVYRKHGSHVTFRHPNSAKATVPAHRPIKPVYVKKFLELLIEVDHEED